MVFQINDTHRVRLMLYHEMLEDDNWFLEISAPMWNQDKREYIMQILAETTSDGDYHTKHQKILNELEVLYKKYTKYGRKIIIS